MRWAGAFSLIGPTALEMLLAGLRIVLNRQFFCDSNQER